MTDRAFRYAADCGKTTLYKFRAYQTKEQRDWVREILVDHKVYFSRASQLNDPFDLTPRLQTATRETLLAGARDYFKRRGTRKLEAAAKLLYLKTCDLAAHLQKAEARMRQRIEEHYWVFSLAGNRDHPMLWSHYADKHTGLCIHFRADQKSVFCASLEVIYDDARPELPVELYTLPEHEVWRRATLMKGKFWQYEDEFRWVRAPDIDYSDLPLRFNGQHAFFPPPILSGVTLGARMPDSDIKELLALAAAHVPPLPVWRARESRGFTFDFESINGQAIRSPPPCESATPGPTGVNT